MPDVRAFFDALGVRLPANNGGNVAVRCFAKGAAHKHDDRQPSCSVSVESGAWLCHGCGEKGGAYDAALALGRTPAEAMDLLERFGFVDRNPADNVGRGPQRRFAEGDVVAWAARLLANDAALDRLLELRCWTQAAIGRLAVGLDGERATFPYRDATGALVGVGRYQPNLGRRTNAPKLKADAGSRRELFPSPERIDPGNRLLWAVEGEPDSVLAHSVGLPAVGVARRSVLARRVGEALSRSPRRRLLPRGPAGPRAGGACHMRPGRRCGRTSRTRPRTRTRRRIRPHRSRSRWARRPAGRGGPYAGPGSPARDRRPGAPDQRACGRAWRRAARRRSEFHPQARGHDGRGGGHHRPPRSTHLGLQGRPCNAVPSRELR